MQEDLESINVTIEECKSQIEKMEALERLRKSSDWKAIIEEGYLKEEAARLVYAKAEPQLQEDKQQKQLLSMIDGVGWFRQYLNTVYRFGNQAKQVIEDHRQTRDKLQQD
jgi:hypothetical protein